MLCHFQVKLAEFSKTPEDFLRKYEELKSKNVRNLDPLVYLLSKLCEDKEVTPHLHAAFHPVLFVIESKYFYTSWSKITIISLLLMLKSSLKKCNLLYELRNLLIYVPPSESWLIKYLNLILHPCLDIFFADPPVSAAEC